MKLILTPFIAALLSLNAFASVRSLPIVGGSNVAPNSAIARRTVALFMVEQDKRGGLCTGSILDGSHILTAAHCVANARVVIVVFATSGIDQAIKAAVANPSALGSNYRVTKNFKQMPGYSNQLGGISEFNDLAVIQFNGGLAPGYEPAHFLNQNESGNYLVSGAPVILSGYGITSVQERDRKTTTGADSSGILRAVQVSFSNFSPRKVDIFVKGANGKDACSGDSGGPAMITANGDTYVVGVASRSDCVTHSIYTWVSREKAASVLSGALY